MVTSVKTLKTEIDCRLAAGGLSSLSCCQLQGACNILANQSVISVASCTALPSASLNLGRIVYLSDIGEYRISDGASWSTNFKSTVSTNVSACVFGTGANYGNGLLFGSNLGFTLQRDATQTIGWCQISLQPSGLNVAQCGSVGAGVQAGGSLWTWGRAYCGRLGNNTTTTWPSGVVPASPVREITSSSNWCKVAAGVLHTAGIKTDGTLWLWGTNSSGQLGINDLSASKSSPVQEISSSTTWCQVTAGAEHSAAIKTDGSLWLWGNIRCGELGNNSTLANALSPIREITSSSNWCTVSIGRFRTSAVKTDGTLWSWGGNFCGQLGVWDTVDRSSPVRERLSATNWCQVSAGPGGHTAAVKTDGTLWTWGANFCGQLGNNAAGAGWFTPVQEISSSTIWCQVAAGYAHTAGVKTDGTLWVWGSGGFGALGRDFGTSRSSPVQEGTYSTPWRQVTAATQATLAIFGPVTCKGFC